METSMERAKIWKEEEDTMSRFHGGLNREIAHSVDKSSHIYLEDMYHEKEHSKRYTSNYLFKF